MPRRRCCRPACTSVDYVELCDAATLEPLDRLDRPAARILAAARLGATRLIDNLPLLPALRLALALGGGARRGRCVARAYSGTSAARRARARAPAPLARLLDELVERALQHRVIERARRGAENAGGLGRQQRLVGVEQLLDELLARAQADVVDCDVALRA